MGADEEEPGSRGTAVQFHEMLVQDGNGVKKGAENYGTG
jgi:hypothetical protein